MTLNIKLADRVKEDKVSDIRVFTLKTDVKDIVTLQGSFLGGSNFSPKKNPLISSVVVAMLDEGTTTKIKHKIQEKLESLGANIEFYCGGLRIGFKATFLKEYTNDVIKILAEELKHPAFDAKRFVAVRKQLIGRLEQNKDTTGVQSSIAFLQELYDKNHPNYPVSTKDKIKFVNKITIEDLKKYHDDTFGSNDFIISAVGDVDKKVLLKSIEKNLGGWKEKELNQVFFDSHVKSEHKKVTKFVTIKDKSTVDIYTGGRLDIDSDHPDFYKLALALAILGSGMTDRLMSEIRDKQGLTYGIYSGLAGFEDNNNGHWSIWSTFAPKVLDKGRKGITKEVNGFVKDGITSKEFKVIKNRVVGRYLIALETTGGLSVLIQKIISDGKELSFIDDYVEIISEISKAEIDKVIKEYIKPAKLVFAGAGSVNEKGKSL